jgi:ketosteroid isomerase-like protein
VRGPADIRDYFEEALAGYGGKWNFEVVAIAEDGDDVFVQWKITGRHEGRVAGLEPTGKPVTMDGIDHFVVRDGKVASNFVVFDQLQLARQVGFVPPDGSLGDRIAKRLFNARTKLARRLRR